MNADKFLLEQTYLNKVVPNVSANHSSVQVGNIPVGAEVTKDYRDEQQEAPAPAPAIAAAPKKEKAGWIEKIDKQNLDKSQVGIAGFGVVELGYLKKNLHDKFQDLAKRVMNNEPNFVYNRIKEKYGFLLHAVRALIEIERDIEKMRRAGKMPGMLKRYNFNS